MRVIQLMVLSVFVAACSSAPAPLKAHAPASAMPMDFARKAVALSLKCVDQEKPHADEGLSGGTHAGKKVHPAFYGCYDWHSAVHGHWAMLRLLNQNPDLPERAAILRKLNRHLTKRNLARELEYLKKNPSFEFPYGDGWLLRLAEEAQASKLPEADAWRAALKPVAAFVAERFEEYMPGQTEPLRIGTHDNTAFALTHVWDFAAATENQELMALVKERAAAFYDGDTNCNIAGEPGPHDFISPCMVEADLQRRVLSPGSFEKWFSAFLPEIPENYLKPTLPANPLDYHEGHLIGLLYQKASSLRAIAARLPDSDPKKNQLLGAIPLHVDSAWKLMFESGYGGSHWIASFAVFYYTEVAL